LFRYCYIFASRCILTSGPCWLMKHKLARCRICAGWRPDLSRYY
jgi:hypothetical protein